MANFTQKAIKDTFISLLEEHPLSDITVKNIEAKSRQSRHNTV